MAKGRNFLQFLIKVPRVKCLKNLSSGIGFDTKWQADGWRGLYIGRFLYFVKNTWNSRWNAVNSSIRHSVKEITSSVCAAFQCVHISVWICTTCLLYEMYLRDVFSANLRHQVTGYYYAKSVEQSQFRESDNRWIPLFLWSLQIHYRIHWTPRLRRLNLVNTVTSRLFKILFNIILPSRRYSEWSLSYRFSSENRVCIYRQFNLSYMSRAEWYFLQCSIYPTGWFKIGVVLIIW